jgi:hypothetical protein
MRTGRSYKVACPIGEKRSVILERHMDGDSQMLVVNVNKTAMGFVSKTTRASKRSTPWGALAYHDQSKRMTYHKTALSAVKRLACFGR